MADTTRARNDAAPDRTSKSGKYHHGDLKEALLVAAETILRRDGIEKLTLRAAAREAGVSHAAPKNHFDNLTGLLSELAARGFERFNAALTGDSTQGDLSDLGRRYVAFARANPDLFVLMFRNTRLDYTRPNLKAAASAGFAGLARATGSNDSTFDVAHAARIASAWSLVHGFAMLMIDGRLQPILEQLDSDGAAMDEMGLLDAVLAGNASGQDQ